MRAVSAKRARLLAERRAMLKRSHAPERCCWPGGCVSAADDPHEVLSRARGGSITDPANVLPLCRVHHDWVTTHPVDAGAMGLLVSRAPAPEDIASDIVPGVTTDNPTDELAKVLLRLSPDLLARIDERAARHRLSRSEWMRLALTRVADMPAQISRGNDQRF